MIDKKQMTKGQQQALNSERTLMRRLEEDLKESLFNVIYVLLKDDETTFWKYFLLIAIDFFQILYYAFHEVIASTWKSEDVIDYIRTFLSFFHIVPWLKEFDLATYLAVFYLCVSLIILIQLDFFYVNYVQNKTKYAFAWPIQALRSVCFLLKTILFLAILEVYVSMLVCEENTSGEKVHRVYNDFQCWTGTHIIHAAFAIISIISIISLGLIIQLTYYKPIGSANDASTKINSRADTQVMLIKILQAFFFQFLTEEKYQWFLIVQLAILSTGAFIRYYREMPYHNERIGIIFAFFSSVFSWASLVLLIAKILEHSSFNGSLQLFFLGIPLLLTLIVFRKDERMDKLLLSVGNFLRGEEVMEQVRYFIQLVSKKDTDKNCDIVLKGYVFQHEDSCPNEQCQLKQFKQSMINSAQSKNMKDKRKKAQQQQQLQMMQNVDNLQLLMQHAKNMYRIGISKFPTNSYLRITYAFFLIEKMNKKQEAIAELNAASMLNPPLDEQFIIYRYKRLSEEFGDTSGSNFAQSIEERSKSNSKANMDLMAKFTYESNFRQLSIHIERCAQFHLEFWNQLREERPDVAKLAESGQHINQSISHVENIWNSLQKLNSNVPKALRLYGKYLMEILHDKEGGMDLLQRAKDAANVKNNYYDGGNMLEDLNDIQQMSSDGTPCIYVSGDLDKIGMITQSNAGATRIFGYSALEIRNHNVEKLMPEMYAKNHSKVLEDALMKGAENIPNKERLVFARHKSGYIFPVWLQLKMVQNISSGIQFVAMFKIDKKLMATNIGFVLLNKEKKIQGISSSCIRLLNMDINRMRRLTTHGYDLNKLAPSLLSHHDDFQTHGNAKQGIQVEWIVPKFERNKNAIRLPQMATLKRKGQGSSKEYKQGSMMSSTINQDQDTGNFNRDGRSSIKLGATITPAQNQPPYTIIEQKFNLNVTISSIVMGDLGEIGYYLRLDSINQYPDKKQIGDGPFRGPGAKNQQRDRVRQPLFQFRFDGDSGRFVRELKESLYIDNAIKDPNFVDGMFVTPNFLDLNESGQADTSPTGNNSKEVTQDQDVSPSQNLHPTKTKHLKAEKQGSDVSIDDKQDAKKKSDIVLGTGYDLLTNEDIYHRRKLWAKGIQIYRLVNGKFVPKDGDEEEKKEKQIEEERKKKMQQDETNLLQLDTFKTNIKSRKALHMAINDTTVPPAIRNLRMTMNIVIACLLALAITEFIIINAQFQDINENFNIIQKSYGQISEVQRVAYDVRTLILINEGKLTNLQRLSTSKSYVDFLRDDIEDALNSIYSLQNYISLSTLSVSDEHYKLLNSQIVPLYFMETNTTFKILNYSLTEAVLQVASAIFTVRHLNVTQYYEKEEDVYFVTYNSFNDFLINLRKSSDLYLSELMSRSSDKNRVILILFLCSVGLLVLAMPILFPAVSSVNKAKVNVLSLFIDIPNGYIQEIANKCEGFLNSYHDDQNMDEIQSEDELGFDGQTGDGGNEKGKGNNFSKRGIHKQAKNTAHTNRNFFIQISFAVFAILTYFVAMFITANNYISDIEILSDELSVSAQLESYFSFAQNTQRELLYNPNKVILNSKAFNASKNALSFLYNQSQLLISQHHANRDILDSDYQDSYYYIFDTNLCTQTTIEQNILPQSCSQLFNNASTHGLETVLSKYFEILRETLQIYNQLSQNITINITVGGKTTTRVVSKNVTVGNITYSSFSQLLNSNYFVDLYLIQFEFIQGTFRNLIQLLSGAVNDQYAANNDQRMALFIIYILGLVLAYLLLWTPFLGKLSREIWRTKSMLTIIPIEIIMKIPKIQEYLNKQAMFNNKKQAGG